MRACATAARRSSTDVGSVAAAVRRARAGKTFRWASTFTGMAARSAVRAATGSAARAFAGNAALAGFTRAGR